MNNNIPNFNSPPRFKEILHDFAREILRFQPKDLIEFGADYFESLNDGNSLNNDPKYAVLLQEQINRKMEKERKKSLLQHQINIRNENENKDKSDILMKNSEIYQKKSIENVSLEEIQANVENIGKNRKEKTPEIFKENFIESNQQLKHFEEKQMDSFNVNQSIDTTHNKQSLFGDDSKIIQEENQSKDETLIKQDGQYNSKNDNLDIQTTVNTQASIEKLNTQNKINKVNNDDQVLYQQHHLVSKEEINGGAKDMSNLQSSSINDHSLTAGTQSKDQNCFDNYSNHHSNDANISNNNEKLIIQSNNETNENVLMQEKIEGLIKINVINLKGENLPHNMLISLKLLNYHQPKEIFTRVVHDNITPVWYFRGKMNLTIYPKTQHENMIILVTLYEKKNNELIELASKGIDLTQVFEDDTKWTINGYFDLEPSNAEISSPPMVYLQMRWLFGNKIYNDYDSEPIDINELDKTIVKTLFQETLVKGFLCLNIIKARNLRAMDNIGEKSDPYCEFWFSHKKQEKEYTMSIFQTLNPVWNEKRVFNINLKTDEANISKLIICVWDQDQVGEDFLGNINFNLRDLIQNPGDWINGWFKLKDENNDKGECGDIYVQLCFDYEEKNLSLIPEILNE